MTLINLPYRPAGTDVRSSAGMMSDFDAIVAVVNGNLDSSNMAAAFAKDVVEPAFSSWKTISQVYGPVVAALANGVYYFTEFGDIVVSGGQIGHAPIGEWLDGADLLAGARTTKYRVRFSVFTNGNGPVVTMTAGLYPIAASSGAANVIGFGLGAVVAGSTAAVAAPAINSVNHAESTAFNAPVAGAYALGMAITGGPVPVSVFAGLAIKLQAQQV